MATPEELLQQEIEQKKEDVKLLRDKLILLEEEKKGTEEQTKLQEELNSKHEELLKTVQEAKESNVELDTSAAEEFLSRIEGIGNAINGNGTAQKEETEEVGWLKKIWTALTTTDPFAKEKADEEKAENEKTRGFLERIAEGIDNLNDVEISTEGMGFGGLLMLLGGIVSGFIVEMTMQIAKVLTKIKNFFFGIGKFFVRIGKFIKGKLPEELVTKFDEGIKGIKSFFGKIGNFFKKLNPFAKNIDEVADGAKGGMKIFSKIGDFLKPFMKIFEPIGKFFRMGSKIGTKFGKLLGPIGLIITIVDGVVQSVKGFIDGFKDGGGLVGGLKGAIEGLFNSIIGDVVNLGADILGWLAKKLGFEEFGQKIMDFDIMTIAQPIIDFFFTKIPDIFRQIKEFVIPIFTSIGDFFTYTFVPLIQDAWTALQPTFDAIGNFFTITLPPIITMMKEKIVTIALGLVEKLEPVFDFIGWIGNALSSLFTGAKEIGQVIFGNLPTLEEIATFLKQRVVSLIPPIFGLRKMAADALGIEEIGFFDFQMKMVNTLNDFSKQIGDVLMRAVINMLPKQFRGFVADKFGIEMDDKGKAINNSAIKEESDRKKFVDIRVKDFENRMRLEGKSEKEIHDKKALMQESALAEFEANFADFQQSGTSIVTFGKEQLRETKTKLIDQEKERKQKEKEEAKSATAAAIDASTKVNNITSVNNAQHVVTESASADVSFFQSAAKDLVTAMGW